MRATDQDIEAIEIYFLDIESLRMELNIDLRSLIYKMK